MMLTLPVQFVLRRMAQSIEFGGSSVIVVMYVLLFIVVAYYYCLLLLFIVLLLCRLMGWRVWCLPVWVLCPSRSAGWLEPPWTSWRECQCVCCVCVCVCALHNLPFMAPLPSSTHPHTPHTPILLLIPLFCVAQVSEDRLADAWSTASGGGLE